MSSILLCTHNRKHNHVEDNNSIAANDDTLNAKREHTCECCFGAYVPKRRATTTAKITFDLHKCGLNE